MPFEERHPQAGPRDLNKSIPADDIVHSDNSLQARAVEEAPVRSSLGHVGSFEQHENEALVDTPDPTLEENQQPQVASSESSSSDDEETFIVDFQRVDGIQYASADALIQVVGPGLANAFPDITAPYFCERNFEDYFPVRLHIGHCYDEKSGVLCQLWAYMKRTNRKNAAPRIKYFLGGPMAVETLNAVHDSMDDENGDIPYDELSHKLSNNNAKLWPLYRPFGNQQVQRLEVVPDRGWYLANGMNLHSFLMISASLILFMIKNSMIMG
jgi:hypothetical protein